VTFEKGEKFQLFLITPPNRDPNKGQLGSCQVSQGGIDVERWYNKYKIDQFFLVYMQLGVSSTASQVLKTVKEA
jgi:hypothetical protein